MNSISKLVPPLLAGLVLISQTVMADTAPLGDRLERASRLSTRAAQSPLTDVQRVGDRAVMVGANGHILSRGVSSTEQADVPVDLLLTAVHFVDDKDGWAVGHDGAILHSTDGGLTWKLQLDGRAISQMMIAWAEAEVARLEQVSASANGDEAVSAALDDANFALDDATAGAEPGPSRPLLDIWFRNANEGWAVGAYGMVLHTRDAGHSWDFVSGLDNPQRLHLNAVLGLTDGSLVVAGEGGRLYRQVEGHWQPVQTLTDASLYKLMELADGRLLALGFGGTLFQSDDRGANWQTIATPSKANLYGGTQLADGSVVLTGQGGVVLHGLRPDQLRIWEGTGKSAWLGAAALPGERLALVGSSGLRVLTVSEFREQLK